MWCCGCDGEAIALGWQLSVANTDSSVHLQSIRDADLFRRSTNTFACSNVRVQIVRLLSVLAGPLGGPRGLRNSGYHSDGMPHSTPALHGISVTNPEQTQFRENQCCDTGIVWQAGRQEGPQADRHARTEADGSKGP